MVSAGAFSQEDIRRRKRKPPFVIDQDIFYSPRVMIATRLDPSTATSTTVTGNGTIATSTSSGATAHGVRIPAYDVRYVPEDYVPFDQRPFLQPLKYYFEVTVTHFAGGSFVGFGLGGEAGTESGIIYPLPSPSIDPFFPDGPFGAICYVADGHIQNFAGYVGQSVGALTDGDTVGIAVAVRQTKGVWFKKVSGTPSGWNDPSNPAADPTIAESGMQANGARRIPWATFGGTGSALGNVLTFNFSGPFVGQRPSGYEIWDAAQILTAPFVGDDTIILTPMQVYDAS